jgi:hypothetical protein
MEENFPGGADTVPFHSRWRHFEAGGLDRMKGLLEGAWASVDPVERARRMIDLAVVCSDCALLCGAVASLASGRLAVTVSRCLSGCAGQRVAGCWRW